MDNNNDKLYLAHFLFPEASGAKEVKDVLQKGAEAERICRLKFSEGEYVQDLCLQVHKQKTLVTGLKETEAFSYELKTPEEIRRACYYLLNCFQLAHSVPPEVPALLMSRSKYEELLRKSGSYTLCFLSECLTAETGDEEFSPLLAKAMKNPTAGGELRLCSRHNEAWSFQQASYMEDHSGGWLVRVSCRASEDWMVAVPLTRLQLCSSFYKWMMQPSEVSNPE
ncbi:hypothetical protein [Paenibacillus sp. S150]|uniref:hypothetical protein n=1 Tax=Paenibacillus sp. S150 TaxID=2749826 RepID=UPI001C598559|nr:hypothetical protein [Paenibacillus sp. S150]MBW4080376.1 hypothetical protein [Paenibacillus sp. S150]